MEAVARKGSPRGRSYPGWVGQDPGYIPPTAPHPQLRPRQDYFPGLEIRGRLAGENNLLSSNFSQNWILIDQKFLNVVANNSCRLTSNQLIEVFNFSSKSKRPENLQDRVHVKKLKKQRHSLSLLLTFTQLCFLFFVTSASFFQF